MVAKKKITGTKKKNGTLGQKPQTRFVLKYRRVKNCPKCGSKRIEGSYGTGGYMQCNACGNEWANYISGDPRKERG
jgi:formate dehydrogenase maturation protein FdhE